MAAVSFQAVRGMNDILPSTIHTWQFVESTLRDLMAVYGYQEIRFPIVENTSLFQRSLGDTTDIVEKEMYTFADRNGDMLTMRPEGTASCVRAAQQHSLLHQLPQRLWYMGPMFRHERPQQGRYRQFHQFGLEAFGISSPAMDAEIIALAARLWQRLGVYQDMQLQINSLGTPMVRQQYREELVQYLTPFFDQLDADSQRRLAHNPLRILDSKNPQTREIVANAPRLLDRLDTESAQHFNDVCAYLDNLNIPYQINTSLVRGLDYYTHTVFEWVTTKLGAQDAVCSGGRYDHLVEQLGGKFTPAVGFALGMERLITLVNQAQTVSAQMPDVYIIAENTCLKEAMALAEQLRSTLPNLRVISDNGGASLKSQFKKADKSGAEFALVLGPEEVAEHCISLKSLRVEALQQRLKFAELVEVLGRGK